MSLKIIHTSDTHLGARMLFLGERAHEQRQQIADTFNKVIEVTLASKADLLLVAGDTFDTPFPANSDISLVLEGFNKLIAAGIYIAVIPGNHDYLAKGSVWQDSPLTKLTNDHYKVFSLEIPEDWYISTFDAHIYGGATLSQKSKRSPLEGLKKSPSGKYHIGLFHGGVDTAQVAENNPISHSEIKAAGLDYLALGDWHSTLKISDTPPCWYSGSPELLQPKQKGAGHVLEVILEQKAEVKQVAVGKRKVAYLELDMSDISDNLALVEQVKQFGHSDSVLILNLTGIKGLNSYLDLAELQDHLRGQFFYVQIKDSTTIEISEKVLEQYPDDLIVGKYIRNMQKAKGESKEKDLLIDKAIQYGVKLLTKVKS